MKKKEIEKIPFRGGVRADKQYRNAAVAFLQNIREESHLFVEVYENKKRELQTPWIRMVFTQKDWGLYYPDAGVWSAAGLDEEREKIGSNCKKRDNKCYMARSQGDIVWKFAGDTWERKYTTWVGALQSLIYNIKAQRVQKREDKRADRLKEREQNTPPLPKGLEDWAKKTGIGTEHFLYYKRHGRYADIACSACGQVTEAAVRSKDTYEGQFEKIIPVPQHDSVGTCPHCGATGIYKAQGKAKGVWGHGMNCFIAQRYKDDGAVIRYVEIEKIYRLDTFLDEKERMIGAGEKMIITEIARTYLEKGKRPQTDYHKFSSYSGEFWDDCNLCGMNNISIKAAKIYPESYKELRTTFLRYSAAEMYGKHKTMYNLKEYLERYIQWPQIEMFVKMGLYHIAESIVEGYCGIIADNSINIEICVNPETDYYKAVDKAEQLAAQLLKQYGWGTDRLKRHYDVSRKNCPRRIQAEGRWPEFVKKTAAYMKGATTVKNTTTKNTVTLSDKIEVQFPVIQKGSKGTAVSMLQAVLGVKVDGDFGNDTETSLKAFQKNVKLTADGICGKDTWTKVIEHMKANTK